MSTPPAPSKVLVLFGGRSAEHEISILSARFIVRSLDRHRFQPLLVGIASSGRWYLQDESQLPQSDDPRQAHILASNPCVWLHPWPATRADQRCELQRQGGDAIPFDVVFPILHGPLGEDGCMQGLCELAAVPYVGAGVAASAVAMDKALQKQLCQRANLPQVPYRVAWRYQYHDNPAAVVASCEELPYPIFVKPANMGSSVGVSRATHRRGLRAALATAFQLDNKVVIEQGLTRAREVEISILGHHAPRASVPGEIVVNHPDGFYSYEAKYIATDGARLVIPAALSAAQTQALQQLALKAYRTLDCTGMARIDMFVDQEGNPYLNEVNTIPGFTAISMYPQLWQASGTDATSLVTRLIDLAMQRGRERQALRTQR